MAWNIPTVPNPGDVATVANWAQKVIDSLNYLKTPTIEIFIPAPAGSSGTSSDEVNVGPASRELEDNLIELVDFTFKVPANFTSLSSLKAVWINFSGGAGNMYWKMQIIGCAASGEAYNTDAEAGVSGVTASGGSGIVNVQAPATPPSLSNIAAGDYLSVRVQRAGDDVLDTLGVSVYLVGLLFTYVSNI